MKTVADMDADVLHIRTSSGDELLNSVTIDDLELPK